MSPVTVPSPVCAVLEGLHLGFKSSGWKHQNLMKPDAVIGPDFGQPEQWVVECTGPNLIFPSVGRTDTLQELKTEIQNAEFCSDVSIDVQGWVPGGVWQPFPKSSLTSPACFGILLQLLRDSHGTANHICGKLLWTTTELLLTARLCVTRCHSVMIQLLSYLYK